jgi:hypothetical protein
MSSMAAAVSACACIAVIVYIGASPSVGVVHALSKADDGRWRKSAGLRTDWKCSGLSKTLDLNTGCDFSGSLRSSQTRATISKLLCVTFGMHDVIGLRVMTKGVG